MTQLRKLSPELAEAQNQVEYHRNLLDDSLHKLQGRIDQGKDDIKRMAVHARHIEAVGRDNPLAGMGIFLLAGFLLGGMIAGGDKTRSTRPVATPAPEGALADEPGDFPSSD